MRNLAAGVFSQALRDAQRGDEPARRWLTEDSPGFSFWCSAYGVCPEIARRGFQAALRNGYATREQKRERIRRVLREDPGLSNREIGRRLGVSYELVGLVRQGA